MVFDNERSWDDRAGAAHGWQLLRLPASSRGPACVSVPGGFEYRKIWRSADEGHPPAVPRRNPARSGLHAAGPRASSTCPRPHLPARSIAERAGASIASFRERVRRAPSSLRRLRLSIHLDQSPVLAPPISPSGAQVVASLLKPGFSSSATITQCS